MLEGLGLASEPLVPPRPPSQASAERRVRPAPGPPTRRSGIERQVRNYAEQGEEEAASESDDEDIWEPAVGATGVPPPDAVVINLVSSDEDGPALLSSHPTRRGGLFIAPSTVQIEQGPLAGTISFESLGSLRPRHSPPAPLVYLHVYGHLPFEQRV